MSTSGVMPPYDCLILELPDGSELALCWDGPHKHHFLVRMSPEEWALGRKATASDVKDLYEAVSRGEGL